MKKILLIAIAALALTACHSKDKPVVIEPIEPKQIVMVDTGWASSWFALKNQDYGQELGLLVPKYSMASGTYTNKHRPMAMADKFGDIYTVFSNNSTDANTYYYVTKGEQRTLVHTAYDWDDTHTNPVVNVLPSGHIKVRMASRGLSFKFQNGAVYVSTEPYDISNFVCTQGCTEDDIVFESYPQPHNTIWGEHLQYTHYERIGNKNVRGMWSMNGDGGRTRLVEGAHYQISHYSELTKTLYTAYNYHVNQHPDSRRNLFIMKTTDGDNWTTVDGFPLQLPTVENSEATVVVDSGENFIYVKDITTDCDGKLRVLFTDSESADPTKGKRWLKEWTEDGIVTLTEVGHNYNSGSYFQEDGDVYVAAGTTGQLYYSGGDLVLYKLTDTGYTVESEYVDGVNWSYLRPVRNGGLNGVVSSGASEADLGSYHHYVEIK